VGLLTIAAAVSACSSVDATARPRAVPESPHPPTVDAGATVDALVAQRLEEAKTITLRTPIATGPAVDPLATPTLVGGNPGATDPLDSEPTATPTPTQTTTPGPTSTATPCRRTGHLSLTITETTRILRPRLIQKKP